MQFLFIQQPYMELGQQKKGHVKYVLCDRLNPLQKIPYLKNPDFKTMKTPHFGIDYNSIKD